MNEVAPPGYEYVCQACGKRSKDRYGDQAISLGWDESCMLNATLVPTLEMAQLEHSDVVLQAHPSTQCAGEVCSLHNRTQHPMRAFPQHWRGDRGIMERLCPHGVGHPDPDDYKVRKSHWEAIHGCDGCCTASTSVV